MISKRFSQNKYKKIKLIFLNSITNLLKEFYGENFRDIRTIIFETFLDHWYLATIFKALWILYKFPFELFLESNEFRNIR